MTANESLDFTQNTLKWKWKFENLFDTISFIIYESYTEKKYAEN